MAQSGYTPIQLYYSTTAAAVPTAGNLASGELAINITDGKLYYKNNSGTVTLLAGSGGAITPITNNGVVYINSSGQATSGSALVFDGSRLLVGTTTAGVVSGGIRAVHDATEGSPTGVGDEVGWVQRNFNSSQSCALAIVSGTASTSSLYFGDKDSINVGSVVYSNSDNSMRFNASGSEVGRFTSTGLGIGTSSPSQKLEVAGNILISTSGNPTMTVKTSGAGNNPGYLLTADTNTWGMYGIFSNATDDLYFQYNGTVRLGLDYIGNMTQVGTNASSGINFTVRNTTDTGGDNTRYSGIQFQIGSDQGTAAIQAYRTNSATDYATALTFLTKGPGAGATSPTERMRITSAGNVGIGDTNPSVPLSVSRNLTGVIASFTNQTSADFQINLSSGVTLLSPSTSILALGTSSTERVRIASNGNLGISTTATDFKVTTQGFAAYTNNTNNTDGSGDAQRNGVGWVATGGSQVLGAFITAASSGSWGADMQFFTRPAAGGNSSEKVRIANDGTVLIRSGSLPTLDQYDAPFIYRIGGGGLGLGAAYETGSTSPIVFYTVGTEAMRINSGQNVGIGTSSISSKVYIAGGTNDQLLRIGNTNAVGSQYISIWANGAEAVYNSVNTQNSVYGSHIWQSTNNGGTVERAKIDSSGYFLLSSSAVYNARIAIGCASGTQSIAFGVGSGVTRASGTQYGYTLYRDSTTETNAVTFVENAGSGNNAASYVVRTNAATGGSGVTNVSGGVALVNGATSWSSYSDLRLKHDVVPVTNAIESILKIDPIFFKWNDRPADQQRSIGVSAQSVEKVFPELIDRSGIYDVEGGAMQVRYTELIPVLLASIQEQQAIIESLKARLDAANL